MGLSVINFSQLSLAAQPFQIQGPPLKPALIADRQYFPALLSRLLHLIGLLSVNGHRLFTHHMLVIFQRLDSQLRMGIIGRTDMHRIYSWIG